MQKPHLGTLWLIELVFLTSNLPYEATEEIRHVVFQLILCFLSFIFYCNGFGSAEVIKVSSLPVCSLVSEKINILLLPTLVSENSNLVIMFKKKNQSEVC